MKGNHLTLAKLEQIADEGLSNFEGQPVFLENYEGGNTSEVYYDGPGDEDFVDFDGNSTSSTIPASDIQMRFAQEIAQGRNYQFVIKNNSTVDEKFILLPSYKHFKFLGSNSMFMNQGVIQQGGFTGMNGNPLEAQGFPKPIDEFLGFVMHVPTRCLGIKLVSSDARQIETSMLIKHNSPFRELESRNILPSLYQDENTFRDKVVTIGETFQLDNQTEIEMTIVAGSTLTVTLMCGAMLNNAKALHNKAKKVATKQGLRVGAIRKGFRAI